MGWNTLLWTGLITDAGHKPPVIAHNYTTKDGLSSDWIHALLESSDGRFWVATNRTLCEFLSSRNERGHSFRAYPKEPGARLLRGHLAG
ncbi:MAG: hypothetical protein HY314_10770 [Acidobacteria bacterium]|nr:hypothetical protein [Acidobacteriota bacterium]